ncbi:MAG: choice-of-anchor tandem repeat GloVer-containing protein [Candidatus Korobacteraceae bacterium]
MLYAFTGPPSEGPRAGVTMDAVGNLYGTTDQDGAYGAGSVFKLTPGADGWVYTSLHDFTRSDGAAPFAGVSLDGAGNLYGTTTSGGEYGWGVVWEITP